jgi:hypothetical protein
MLLVNAAQVAGSKVWGQAVDFPAVNRTHAILQSLSFWLPGDNPLWVHRLWNSLLWLIVPLGMAASLGRRLRVGLPVQLFFALFGYLFLSQGPVYFNLAVIPLVILSGFRSDHKVRSLALVLIASIWAGLSRINWYPVAGILVALLYILETPYDKKFWHYFWQPLGWVAAGTITAFLSNSLVLALSSNPLDQTLNYLRSSLLWYRLWPSATFSMGILPALCLTCAGLLGLLGWKVLAQRGVHVWRRAAISVILLIFLLGGLVVSVKIGGGNNLHNLDAFFVLLLVTAGYTFFDRISKDSGPISSRQSPKWLITVIILLPYVYLVPFLPYRAPVNQHTISRIDNQLEKKIETTLKAGSPILFISNQQMVAINRFPGILPEPEYEVVNMMEMAMVGNAEYFAEFYQQLSQHRWGLIVIDSLSLETAGREKSFGEEQTAWVKWVVEPIRKYYIPVGGNLQAMLILAEPR